MSQDELDSELEYGWPDQHFTAEEAIHRFFTLREGADVSYYEPTDADPDGKWGVITLTDYARRSPGSVFSRDKRRTDDEIWWENVSEFGDVEPVAVRNLRTGQIWFYQLGALDGFVERCLQAYFPCGQTNPEPALALEPVRAFAPRSIDCEACPNYLACVTKGWSVNTP